MDAIPVEIRVVRLEAGRAGRVSRLDLTNGALGDRLGARGKAEGRGAEIDHAGFLRGFLEADDVGERARNRLIDEDRLTGLQHRQDLLEVHAAVIGLEHHEVDLRTKLLDRIDDLDAHALEASGIFRHALGALGDVLATLGKGMRYAEA